ncbi:MAG: helix-turn-helix domain-containing protein [Aeromicrobium sp.]|uniref:PucR family transcriptional regulator n=1 Tax=Aeromicrobium sp. TaxID=1871063 RepID=UPI0039E6D525
MRTPAPDLVPHDEQIRDLASLAASRLNEREREITRSMTELLSHIDYLDGDQRLLTLLDASIGGNVQTILHMLINDIPVANLQPAAAAVEYALRLAQRGVPANSLIRAYHMGQDDLMMHCFEEAQRLDCDSELKLRVVHHMSGQIYRYIDWISMYLLDVYETEQSRWNTTAGHVRTAMLRAVLAGEEVDLDRFAEETDYELKRTHVGLVMWGDARQDDDSLRELQQAARRIAVTSRCAEPLFSAVDRSTAWVWVPLRRGMPGLSDEAVREALAGVPGGRAAVGSPGQGVEGFRRTYGQAEAVREVVSASADETVVMNYGHDGIAALAMLMHDMDALRTWVQEVLGELAADTPSHASLRETLRVLFACGGRQSDAAEQLVIHRNTLKYRLEKASRVLGRPLDRSRLDTELALQACHYLGPKVLRGAE